MRIGHFVPCYVDASHPEVGIGTLELLGRFGIEVEYAHHRLLQQRCGRYGAESGQWYPGT
jgi:Fe-S oxidoreductase